MEKVFFLFNIGSYKKETIITISMNKQVIETNIIVSFIKMLKMHGFDSKLFRLLQFVFLSALE